MKSIFTITFFALSFLFSAGFFSQTINITDADLLPLICANYNDGSVINFEDNGGSANYGSNRNDIITVCPDLPNGPKITLVFATNIGFTFDVHPTDTLYVFDGINTSAPLLGKLNSGINANGGSFVSSFENNASGCLTIQFISDGANEGTGWGANISCGSPAQPFYPHLEAFVNGQGPNALNPIDTGYVDICLGDSVLLVAKPLFPYSLENNPSIGGYSQTINNVEYLWEMSSGWQGANNDSVWFKPTTRNGFYLNLTITDIFPQIEQISCKIRVGQQPLFIGTGPLENPICENQQVILNGGANSTDTVGVQFPPVAFDLGGTLAGLTYLPDGSGQEYSTTITMDDFPDGAIFSGEEDLQSICLTMEHSFIGDLEVWLTCPNGAQVALINAYGAGAIPGGFGGGGTYLGDADDNGNGTPGIGWEYCFSSVNNTWGTMEDESNAGNTITSTISPTGPSMNPNGVYLPHASFSNFDGCPLNGDWTIHVRDNQGIDDGYIFQWGLYFSSDLFPDFETYSNYLIDQYWVADPTIIATQADTAIVAIPGAAGTHDYTFVVTDNFGCVFDTTVTIQINPLPTVDPVTDQTVCDGEDFLDIFFTGSANTAFNWTNSNPNIGLPASGTGDIPAFTSTGTNPLSGAVTATITVTPFIEGGCEGVPITFTLTVNATEDGSFDIDDSYCTTQGVQVPVMTTTTPGGIFESFSGVTVDPSTGEFDVSLLADGQYEITYNTPGNTGFCPTNSSEYFTVANPSNLTVNLPASQTVCDNTLFSATSFSGNSSGAQYMWTNDNTSIGLAASGEGNIGAFIAQGTVDGSTNSITANITVTPFAGACVMNGNAQTFTLSVNPKPAIDAIPDFTICEGDAAVISVASSTGNVFNWDNGVSGVAQTLFPTDTEEYKVTTTMFGCTNIDSLTVTVNDNPIVDAGFYSSVCIDAPQITLIGLPAGGTFTGSGVTGGFFNPAFDDQKVYYNYTDLNGCMGIDSATIVVNSLPTVTISPVSAICEGQSATLTANGAFSYSWDNNLGNGSPQTVTPTNSTVYTVEGTDANGCQNIATIMVDVNPLPNISAGNDVSICLGEDTTIIATGGITYVWDQGLGLGSTHTVSPTDSTTYTVVGTDVNGCINTDEVVVNIIGPPVISAGNDTTICAGNPITLVGSGTTSYSWNNGVTNNVSFIPPTGITTYGLTGTSADGCTAYDEAIVTVLAQPIPIVIPSVTFGTPTLTVNFVNLSENATTYTWDLGNGSATITLNDLTGQTGVYETIQSYTVTFTASNGLCSNDTTILITVINFDPVELEVPNIFSPQGDGKNDWYHLNVKNAKSLEAQIFNRWGNLVYEINGVFDPNVPATYWDGKINDKEAKDGVYFIKYSVFGYDGSTITGHENIQLVR